MHPVVDPLVPGKPQFAERCVGAEGRRLRAEISATHKDAVDVVADAGVYARQVLQRNLGLALKDGLDVPAPRPRGNVPFGHVANAFGFLQ